jgi:hypothetical protein
VLTRREQVIDSAEHLALQRSNLEPLEIRPVILSRPARRQLPPLDRDLGSHPFACRVPIVDAVELDDDSAVAGARIRDARFAAFVAAREQPRRVLDDVVARLGLRMDFEPAFDAVHAADTAERDELARVRAHYCGSAARGLALRPRRPPPQAERRPCDIP